MNSVPSPARIPFLDLHAQYLTIRDDIHRAIEGVFEESRFVLGPAVARFEESFAAYCGVKHAVGVTNGTNALILLFTAAGIGPGDEVIVPANTFVATAEAVCRAGATPVFVDCDADTGLIDPSAVAAALTEKTKAVVPVHLYGQMAPMREVAAVAEPRGIAVFEDACQAHGARQDGKRAGSVGKAAAFSFYPGKNLGAAGEAGAVVTNDEELAARLRLLRNHGMPRKYVHDLVGFNARMHGIQGAVLSVKLPHLDAWNARRRAIAARYDAAFAHLPDIRPMRVVPGNEHVYHLYVIRSTRRDALAAHLAAAGIETGIHYPYPIHLQKAYADSGKGQGSLPRAEALAGDILSLPIYPELPDTHVDEVVAAIRDFATH
ncbi:DegT/DnrJ/EryC1/StrS family aminotransferase [Patescibacteria group bacterium]|nr:MAG: DegT/DnrJ/EryC1/StrS family aminotransferase [Patescibacteria group bacterium]